jgi:hypothetical protein
MIVGIRGVIDREVIDGEVIDDMAYTWDYGVVKYLGKGGLAKLQSWGIDITQLCSTWSWSLWGMGVVCGSSL